MALCKSPYLGNGVEIRRHRLCAVEGSGAHATLNGFRGQPHNGNKNLAHHNFKQEQDDATERTMTAFNAKGSLQSWRQRNKTMHQFRLTLSKVIVRTISGKHCSTKIFIIFVAGYNSYSNKHH